MEDTGTTYKVGDTTYKSSMNDIARAAHTVAKDNGFWAANVKQELGTKLMLVVSELVEILEADRSGKLHQVSPTIKEITNFEEEMADVFIRLLDLVGAYKLNIDLAMKKKMMLNQLREYKHRKEY